MTQLDPLSDALAAASLHTHTPPVSTLEQSARTPAKTSFASALRSGQTVDRGTAMQSQVIVPALPLDSTPASTVSSLDSPLAPVDDTILQAMRKRDDRIFFSQYEHQMSTFVRDPTRSKLELGAMNAYQRLLVHRCADQFQLEHQLDRTSHCITLSRTPATSHPPALLSLRAREHLLERDGVDPLRAHPTSVELAGTAATQAMAGSPCLSASTSSPSSPASTATGPTAMLNAPKAGFKIMRRDPSSTHRPSLRSADNDTLCNNSESERTNAKARKDMTLEEREASYRAARARIFGDTTPSGSTSPTSATSHVDQPNDSDLSKDTASARDTKPSPAGSAASSPVASIAGGRVGTRKKVQSSSSSVASQDGSAQRRRGSGKGKASHGYASDSTNDDLEFCRALPLSGHAATAFGAGQQPSPLALPAHVAHGYFPPTHPTQLQQSHSNPNLRSRAPAFHPQGSSTPSYSQGGALRYPDMGAHHSGNFPPGQSQRPWIQPAELAENDAFPALSSTAAGQSFNGANGGRQTHTQANVRKVQASCNGAWNRSPAGHEHHMHGVGAWAQQTSTSIALQQQQQVHFQQGVGPYSGVHPSIPPHFSHAGQQVYALPSPTHAGSRSANSSRTNSQRSSGGYYNGRGARDDAMSVGSISSTSSSRSASLSGVSATGTGAQSTNMSNGRPTNSSISALSHPSLPARPAWLSPQSSAGGEGESGQN